MQIEKDKIKPFCFKNDKQKVIMILNRHQPQFNSGFDTIVETIKSEAESSYRQTNISGLSQLMSDFSTFSRESIIQIKRSGFNFRNSKEKISQIIENNSKESFSTLDLSIQITSQDQQQTMNQKNKQKFNFRQKKSVV